MLRPATADDYYRFYGRPWRWPVIAGLVADNGWMIEGIGGLYQREDGTFWVFLSRAPGVVNRRELVKAAREIMTLADECNVPVHAYADPRIGGADKLLAHLGFEQTETIENDLRVWTRGSR